MPGILLMEGATTGIEGVITTMETLAQTIQTNGLAVINGVLPIAATVGAAIIVARIGKRVILRFVN